MEKKKSDMHIISMHKGIHQAKEAQNIFSDESDEWLVLGGFDTLSISPLGSASEDETHILKRVWKDLENTPGGETQLGTYHNNLYLLPPLIEHRDSKDRKFPFMFVTRIRENSHYQKDSPEWTLHSTVQTALGDEVEFACYPTLGLSDLVLIMWSNSLEYLLTKVECLFVCPYIGDTYTFCCIAKKALTMLDQIQDKDNISLVSIQLAVRNADKACQKVRYWRKLLQKERSERPGQTAVKESYFVIGSADVNILLQNISSYSLVLFLKDVLEESNLEPDDVSLWEAFDDMTTQLGRFLDGSKEESNREYSLMGSRKRPYPEPTPLPNILYDAFVSENNKLRKVVEDERGSWIYPMFQLMNSFVYLSKNRALDQLCYVLLSGVQGFVVKLQEREKKFGYISDLYTFVDKLSFVKEHIIRMESPLGQHPGTRPVLFSLPVNTIESYLAFVDLCADFLQISDKDADKKRFYFLIVPCLCETVSVQSMLYSQDESNHLLYIKIPLEQCYCPNEVGLALAHEISHYSGELSRNRTLRFSTLLYCCSFLLCKKLGFKRNRLVIQSIMREIDQNISNQQKHFMNDIEPALDKACRRLVRNEAFLDRLRDILFQEIEDKERYQELTKLNERFRDICDNGSVEYVLDVMLEIEMLSRECYADLAMFSLLPITARDYIPLILKRRNSGLEKPDWQTRNIGRTLFVERISLVLSVVYNECEQLQDDCFGDSLDEESRLMLEDIKMYCTILCALGRGELVTVEVQNKLFAQLREHQDAGNILACHPLEIVYTLRMYLTRCYTSMPKWKQYTEGAQIGNLYKAMISPTTNGETKQDGAIRRYRSKVMDRSRVGGAANIKEILEQVECGLCSKEAAIDALMHNFHLSKENAQTIITLK